MIFHPRETVESICHYIAAREAHFTAVQRTLDYLCHYIRARINLCHKREHKYKYKYKKQKYTNTLDSTFAITSAPTSISVTRWNHPHKLSLQQWRSGDKIKEKDFWQLTPNKAIFAHKGEFSLFVFYSVWNQCSCAKSVTKKHIQ